MPWVAWGLALAVLLSTVAPQEQETTAVSPFTDLSTLSTSSVSTSQQYMNRGQARFKRNMVEGACRDFDHAMQQRNDHGSWQRGIALYYQERLVDCRDQFAADVAGNPNDTEETIWHFICNARLHAQVPGVTPAQASAAARVDMLPVGQENRPVMQVAITVFTGTATVADLLATAGSSTSSNSYFYAHFYAGLWYEASGQAELAQAAMVAAATSGYGQAADNADYMWHTARVHSRRRGWDGSRVLAALDCADADTVNALCPCPCVDGVAMGIPSSCTSQCAAAFIPFLENCAELQSESTLVAFGALCAVGGSGGH